MADTVDLQALANRTASLLLDARTDFEDRIERIQEIVTEIDWEELTDLILMPDITNITFDNYENAKDLLDGLVFNPIREKELFDGDIEKYKVHMFISPSLDDAENKIVEILSGAGDDEFKKLSGAMLSTAIRDSLDNKIDQVDDLVHTRLRGLVGGYQTGNTNQNQSWMDTQRNYKRQDRDRTIFKTLFDLAQENIAWAYKNGIKIERLHENFTARYNRLFLDLTAANIAAYRAEVDANIANFEAELRAIVEEIKNDELRFKRDSAEWDLRVRQYNSRLRAYVADYRARLATNLKLLGTRISGGKNVADGYKAIYSAYSGQYSGVALSNSGE